MKTASQSNDVVFGDDFIRKQCKTDNPDDVIHFEYDYSPGFEKINQITPFTYFLRITDLSLVGHSFKDLIPFQSLVNLQRLNLSWCNISNILPLTKISTLLELSLAHNAISTIPKSISSLSMLQILRLNSNPIFDQSQILNLKQNYNLKSLDLEGTVLAEDRSAIAFATYSLPQISCLNGKLISSTDRKDSALRFKPVDTVRSDLEDENQQLKTVVKSLQDENSALIEKNEKLSYRIKDLEKQLADAHDTRDVEKAKSQMNLLVQQAEKLVNTNKSLLYQNGELKRQMQAVEQEKIKLESKLQSENDDLREEIEQIKSQAPSRADFYQLKKDVATKDDEVTELRNQVEGLLAEIDRKNAEITDLKDTLQEYPIEPKDFNREISKRDQLISTLQSTSQLDCDPSDRNKQLESAVIQLQSFIQDLTAENEHLKSRKTKTSITQIKTDQIVQVLRDQLEATTIDLHQAREQLKQKPKQVEKEIVEVPDTKQRAKIKELSLELQRKELAHQTELLSMNETIAKTKQELEFTKAALQRANKEKEDLTMTIGELDNKAREKESRMRTTMIETETDQSKARTMITELRKKDGEKAAQIDQYKKTINEHQEIIEKRNKDLYEVEAQCHKLQEQVVQLQESLMLLQYQRKKGDEEHQATVEELQTQIETTKKESKTALKEKQEEVFNVQKELRSTKRKLGKIVRMYDALAKDKEKSDNLVTQLQIDLADSQAQTQIATSDVQRINDGRQTTEYLFQSLTQKYNALQKEYDALKDEVEKGNQSRSSLFKQIQTFEDNIKDLELKLSLSEQEVLAAKQSTKSQTEAKNQYQTELESVKMENHQLQVELAKVQTEKERNNKQFADLTVQNERLKQSSQKVEILQKQLDETKAEMQETLKAERQTAYAQIAELNDAKTEANQKIQDLITQLSEAKAKLQEKTMKEASYAASVERKADALAEKEHVIQLKTKALAKAEDEIAHLRAELDATQRNDEEEIDTIRQSLTRQLESVRRELNEVQQSNKSKEEEASRSKREMDQLKSKLAAAEKLAIEKGNIIDQNKREAEKKYAESQRMLADIRKQLHDLSDEKQEIYQQMSEAEAALSALQREKEGMIGHERYKELDQKYQSLKKLQKFEAKKSEEATTRALVLEKQIADAKEHENEMREQLKDAKDHERNARDEATRLRQQLEIADAKLADLSRPQSPKIPKSALDKAEQLLQQKEIELGTERAKSETFKDRIQELKESNSNTKKKNESLLRDLQQAKSDLEKSSTALHEIHEALSSGKLSPEVNSAFKKLSMAPINLYKPQIKKWASDAISIEPNEKLLSRKEKELIGRLKKELMTFPIHTSMEFNDSPEGIEMQIEQLNSIVGMVRRVFNEREKHIEEMAKLIASQHNAVLAMSDPGGSQNAIQISQRNFDQSQRIITQDRASRDSMH